MQIGRDIVRAISSPIARALVEAADEEFDSGLLVNGNFADGFTGWIDTSDWYVADGRANNDTGDVQIAQAFEPLQIGHNYRLTYDCGYPEGEGFTAYLSNNVNTPQEYPTVEPGSQQVDFTASHAHVNLALEANGEGGPGYWVTNVKLIEVV